MSPVRRHRPDPLASRQPEGPVREGAARYEAGAAPGEVAGVASTADARSALRRAERLGHDLRHLGLSVGPLPGGTGSAPPAGRVQRVTGLSPNTHVEVDDGGPLWYGQIVDTFKDSYRIRLGGADRLVTVPASQVRLHPVVKALQVRKNIRQAPEGAKVLQIVQAWSGRAKIIHDPYRSLELMARAHLLSINPGVAKLLDTSEGVEKVKELVREVETDTGRQLVQSWNENPAAQMKQLSYAWSVFLDGLEALKGSRDKLDLYLDKCLNHDKGYAQTFTATQTYVEIASSSGTSDADFGEVLKQALGFTTNRNIWTGGMQGSGKIIDQLERGPDKGGVSAEKQEGMMWSALLRPIIDAHSPIETDWTYTSTIAENFDELFEVVQKLVPVELNKELMKQNLSI